MDSLILPIPSDDMKLNLEVLKGILELFCSGYYLEEMPVGLHLRVFDIPGKPGFQIHAW